MFYAQSSSAVISGGGGTNPVWTGTAENIAIQFWRRERERLREFRPKPSLKYTHAKSCDTGTVRLQLVSIKRRGGAGTD